MRPQLSAAVLEDSPEKKRNKKSVTLYATERKAFTMFCVKQSLNGVPAPFGDSSSAKGLAERRNLEGVD